MISDDSVTVDIINYHLYKNSSWAWLLMSFSKMLLCPEIAIDKYSAK